MTTTRPATAEDGKILAELSNLASHGYIACMWTMMSGDGADPIEFGASRVSRGEGNFSYKNAFIEELDGTSVGAVLCYRLDDPYELPPSSAVPGFAYPYLELESKAAGTFNVYAVAVVDGYEGTGIGKKLMAKAETVGRQSGADTMSLIVVETNARARGLYSKLGYEERARAQASPPPGIEPHGDLILMVKAL